MTQIVVLGDTDAALTTVLRRHGLRGLVERLDLVPLEAVLEAPITRAAESMRALARSMEEACEPALAMARGLHRPENGHRRTKGERRRNRADRWH